MRFGSLFSGIGGLDLGLERAGMEIIWQVEIDPFCQKVLRKHWPGVPLFGDVRDVGKHNLEPVDLICGGFPCQDISQAGKKEGIDGKQSGLWREMARVVCELRPRVVLVENVSALHVRGLGHVLGDLAKFGYDAEWEMLRACIVGAPHLRPRLFVLAHTNGLGSLEILQRPENPRAPRELPTASGGCPTGWRHSVGTVWETEPGMGRVADGFPDRVGRIRGTFNAVVPQVAEWIGQRIMEAVG